MTATETIFSLRPNVTREDAIRAFSHQGFAPWRMVQGTRHLRAVAELYVPFTLFQATIRHGNTHDVRLLAVDHFCGDLDPFIFTEPPDTARLLPLNTPNRLDCVLSEEQVKKHLTTKLQRVLFQKGFFRVGHVDIRLTAVAHFYMPYWLAFFGSGTRVSLKILDATRRVYEGNKLRSAVEQWLCR